MTTCTTPTDVLHPAAPTQVIEGGDKLYARARGRRVRVVILDDDRNWAEIVRRTYVYSALSVASMFFALIGNDLCSLRLAAEHDVAVGWATLAVFVFFIFDIVINVKLLKWGYALSVRFVLDLIATLVMLFFVPDFIDLMSSLFGQGFLQIVTQGSAARASRAARAGFARRAHRQVDRGDHARAGIDFVKEHAAQYPMLSKVFGRRTTRRSRRRLT